MLWLAPVLFLVWAGANFLRPWWDNLATRAPEASAWMEMRSQQGQAWSQAWVNLPAISKYLAQAVLIAEDDRFFGHDGFDWRMLRKAVERNLDQGSLKYGASTLTQQLAKNLYLSPERSLVRKLQEAFIALGLETFLDKHRILELYLNLAEWGPGVFGAQAAARHYFHRPAAKLTPWQAALLAAALPSPLRYRADRPGPYLTRRARQLLNEMRRRGLGVIWR